MRVPQLAGERGLVQELRAVHRAEFRVAKHLGLDRLERDFPAGEGVLGEIDGPGRPLAERCWTSYLPTWRLRSIKDRHGYSIKDGTRFGPIEAGETWSVPALLRELLGGFEPAHRLGPACRSAAANSSRAGTRVDLGEHVGGVLVPARCRGWRCASVRPCPRRRVTDLADAVLQAAHVEAARCRTALFFACLAADVARHGPGRRTTARDGHHQHAAAHAVIEPIPHPAAAPLGAPGRGKALLDRRGHTARRRAPQPPGMWRARHGSPLRPLFLCGNSGQCSERANVRPRR